MEGSLADGALPLLAADIITGGIRAFVVVGPEAGAQREREALRILDEVTLLEP